MPGFLFAPVRAGASPSRELQGAPPVKCAGARTVLGRGPRIIRFSADCRASTRGQLVSLEVARYPVVTGRRSEVLDFSRRPRIDQRGASRHQGRCLLKRGIVICQARLAGVFKLSGWLAVEPGRRCEKRVQLLLIEYQCLGHDGPCPASGESSLLADGLPQGC